MTQRRSYGLATALLGLVVTVACGSDEGTGGGDDAPGSLAGNSTTAGNNGNAGSGRGGSGTGGSGTTAGSSTGGSGTTAGSSSTAGSPGAGGMSVGDPCMVNEPPSCVDPTRARACVGGVYEEFVCSVVCTDVGFASGTCTEGCLCDEPVNTACELGAAALCVCAEAEGAEPCTDAQFFNFYGLCHVEDPDFTFVPCLADFVDQTAMTVDCDAAATACLPPVPAQ